MDRGAFHARHKLVEKRNNRDILSSILKVAKTGSGILREDRPSLTPTPSQKKRKNMIKNTE